MERFAASRLAAPGAAPEELPVDASGGVRLAQDHVQAPAPGDFGIERDIGAASRHAGGHGDAPRRAGRGDHLGFGPVVPGVEQHMVEARSVHRLGERLRIGDGIGADQDRTPGIAQLAGALRHKGPARPRIGEHARGQDPAQAGHAQWHARHAQPIHLRKLPASLRKRTAHAANPKVAGEESLVGQLGHGFEHLAGTAALLELDHLVQPARPGATRRRASGRRVDELHAAVAHQVIAVAVEEVQRAQREAHRLLAVARQRPQAVCVVRARGERLASRAGQLGASALRIEREIAALLQTSGKLERALEMLGAALRRPGARQDERHARFVQQHAVGFVDDRHAQAAQHGGPGREPAEELVQGSGVAAADHRIAQIVEYQLFRRAVGDIAGVGRAARGRVHLLRDDAGGEPQASIERPQVLAVATGEIIVHRDEVHGHARQRRHSRCERRGEGLALPRGHLGQALVEHRTRGMELDGVGPCAELARGELPDDCEGKRHRMLGDALLREAPAQLGHARRECLVANSAQVHALHAAHELRVAARRRR